MCVILAHDIRALTGAAAILFGLCRCAVLSEEQFRGALDYVFQSKGQSVRVAARSADGKLHLP
jgi:hypothetical protein